MTLSEVRKIENHPLFLGKFLWQGEWEVNFYCQSALAGYVSFKNLSCLQGWLTSL